MSTLNSGHQAHPRRERTRSNRQLTLGECIAIARYAESYADDGTVGLMNILDTIDRLGVCTTCGWSKATHVTTEGPVHEIGLCAQWTRAGVHN